MRCLYNGVHPCGRCPACLANRQRSFMFRLDQEKDNASYYFWLTLSYSDEFVPHANGEMCFSKKHCHGFFEKLRFRYRKKGITFKHFLVSEYGPNNTERPHYHCLLMVYSSGDLSSLYKERKEMREYLISDAWPYGHVTEKAFHGRVIRYLTKYCLKPELIGQYHRMKPFTLISRGIGLSFFEKIPIDQIQKMKDDLDFTYRYGTGKIQLPRYYVDRILPHSLEDLRNCSDELERIKIHELRRKLSAKRAILDKKRINVEIHERQILGTVAYDRRRERQINTCMNNFKANLKKRKDV